MIIIYYKIKDIPIEERPRERLKSVGPNNLTDKELLSIIIKTGTKNKNASDIALDILKKYSLQDLQEITISELTKITGIGEVKALEIISSIELGKRIFLKQKNKLKKLTERLSGVDMLHLNFTYKDSKICANSQLSGTTFKTFCLPYPLSGIL